MDSAITATASAIARDGTGPVDPDTVAGGVPLNLSHHPSAAEALSLVPEAYAREHHVLPLAIEEGVLVVALADPDDPSLLAELRFLTRSVVRGMGARREDISQAIQERYNVLHGVDRHVRAFAERDAGPVVSRESLEAISESSPVVHIANLIITQALRERASDVHIEPQQGRLRIRFRIDGLLADVLSLPASLSAALASRLKVMASMDIVDRHRAQDGQIRMQGEGRNVDIRVSTTETIWGEKVVLRILDRGRSVLSLDQLGLAEQGFDRLTRLLRAPFGMVVVTGPTGSGKTTTLYAAINRLDAVVQNITTIEDPVEYTFDNINQIQIRKMANVTFANGLKAILRQDPDVILVGEIRDQETAEIAVQSSLTGHLVLSSLHSTDAAGAVQRFIEMGIEGFLISSSLIGVVAQRLVRRMCEACREPYTPSPEEAELWRAYSTLQKHTFYRGRGCGHCSGTGYRGRIGVFEVMPLSDQIKRLVSAQASAQEIREQAIRDGLVPLRGDAIEKVAADETTLSEVIRCVWQA